MSPAAHKWGHAINKLTQHYNVHPTLIHRWKKQLVAGAEEIFGSPPKAASTDSAPRKAGLFEQIGRINLELEWAEENLPLRLRAEGHWLGSIIWS